MPYSQAWLEDTNVRRCVLVELDVYDVIAANTITMYISNSGYITTTSDVLYVPILASDISITENISETGQANIGFGDIEIINTNGQYDSWLDSTKYIWVNNGVRAYYGDPVWATTNKAQVLTDFKLIFDGIIADIDSRSRGTLNIKIRDKMQRLNTPITETTIGTQSGWGAGGQTNTQQIRPLVFGEVFNIEPALIDPSINQYMFTNGTVENLIEVRDNGVPIYNPITGLTGATVNLTTGTFTLTKTPVGTVTCSVQGIKSSMNLATGAVVPGVYNNNIAHIIGLIVRSYGDSANGKALSANDMDLTNFNAFALANTQPIGVYIDDRVNVLDICDQISSSVGAQLFFNRLGKLQLLKYGTIGSSVMTVTTSDILENSLAISEKVDVIGTTILGYSRNHTVQEGLITSIPQNSKDSFAQEWLQSKSTVDTTSLRARYKLSDTPTQKDTSLIQAADALAEANRLVTYYSTPRFKFRFTARAKLLSLNLGDTITLIHPRFNLSTGKLGQVISLNPNWIKGTIDIEVIV